MEAPGGMIFPGASSGDFTALRRLGSPRGPFAAQQVLESQLESGLAAVTVPDGFDDNCALVGAARGGVLYTHSGLPLSAVWVYEHFRLIIRDLNTLIARLQGHCTARTCPVQGCGDLQYLCASHAEPRECPALAYMVHTVDGAAARALESGAAVVKPPHTLAPLLRSAERPRSFPIARRRLTHGGCKLPQPRPTPIPLPLARVAPPRGRLQRV